MDAHEVVVSEVQRHGRAQVLDLLAERVRQASKSSHVHAHGQVLPLDVAGADLVWCWLADDRPATGARDVRWAVSTRTDWLGFVALYDLTVVDARTKRLLGRFDVGRQGVRGKLHAVIEALPKRLQGKAKRLLHEIINAPTGSEARELINQFESDYGAKYPKAVASLRRDQAELLTYFELPAEHWVHLRTVNPIESAFATVRLRQRLTKGAGSRTKGLTMAFKLLQMAQQRWRRINAPHLTALVLEGATFLDGIHHIANETAA